MRRRVKVCFLLRGAASVALCDFIEKVETKKDCFLLSGAASVALLFVRCDFFFAWGSEERAWNWRFFSSVVLIV